MPFPWWVWWLIFNVVIAGPVGAMIAGYRGRAPIEGFLWGVVLSPVGWVIELVLPPGNAPVRQPCVSCNRLFPPEQLVGGRCPLCRQPRAV